jgi:RHS repeat-associated protein
VAEKVGYTGHADDAESGLTYAQARYYDPVVGRFLSPDPVRMDDDFNLYAYVRNNPTNLTDPTGLLPPLFDQSFQDGLNDGPEGVNLDRYQKDDHYRYGVMLTGISNAMQESVSEWRGGGGGKGPCCFVAGTQVQTDKGPRAIETIRVGDLVLSRDESTGHTTYKRVTDILVDDEKTVWELDIVDTSGDAETHRVTDNHPYWVVDRGWVQVADLVVGMVLSTSKGSTVKIVRTHDTGKVERTYNLEVSDFHTFFVGQKHVLVHNACNIGKTHTTYTRKNESTGKTYSGKTSGTGTAEQQVKARTSKPDHQEKTKEGYGTAVVDKNSGSSDAIRGREQQLIESNGGAKSQGGTSGNAINSVSPSNQKAPQYEQACNNEFGCSN